MVCPFCGIVTDAPHESQEACIAALHAEIDRVRLVVDCLQSTVVPSPAEPAEEVPSPQVSTPSDQEESQF